jgi:GNAT superfamily N-acetyltransferase
MSEICYQIEPNLTVEEFKEVLIKSNLGERRPIDDEKILLKMLAGAQLIYTARHNQTIVGVARSISDGVYCTYLSDLAVDEEFQHRGIGIELIRLTKLEFPTANLILLSAPKAVDYYPKIGMTRHEHAFMLKNAEDLI